MFPESRAAFLTSQILSPKRPSRRPPAKNSLTTSSPMRATLTQTLVVKAYNQKFNCRFASRPICHLRAGSALPSIGDLDERSRERHEQPRGCDEHEDAGDHDGEEDPVHFCPCGPPMVVPILAGPASDARSQKETPAGSEAGAGSASVEPTRPVECAAAVEVEGRSRPLEASAESVRPEQLVRRPGSRWPA